MRKKRAKKSYRKEYSSRVYSHNRPSPFTLQDTRNSFFMIYNFRLVLRNLTLFLVLSLISFLLYYVSESKFYENLFLLVTFIFGFITLAFFIVLLGILLSGSKNKER